MSEQSYIGRLRVYIHTVKTLLLCYLVLVSGDTRLSDANLVCVVPLRLRNTMEHPQLPPGVPSCHEHSSSPAPQSAPKVEQLRHHSLVGVDSWRVPAHNNVRPALGDDDGRRGGAGDRAGRRARGRGDGGGRGGRDWVVRRRLAPGRCLGGRERAVATTIDMGPRDELFLGRHYDGGLHRGSPAERPVVRPLTIRRFDDDGHHR